MAKFEENPRGSGKELSEEMKSCSKFAKTRKTLAYVLRFNNNTRLKAQQRRRHFARRIERIRTVII